MRLGVGLLAIVLVAGEAEAGGRRMSLEPGDGRCFARVRIENRAGQHNTTETLMTSRGPVSIYYDTIGGHEPGDDDLIEVTGLPRDVFADPMKAAIPDDATLSVCLFDWQGM